MPEHRSLSVTATSDNTGLIPNPTVNYTSPNATGSISYTPVANQTGTAHVTVTVRDAGLDGVLGNSDDKSIAKSFMVIVNPSVTFPDGMVLHLDASMLNLANGAAVTGLTDLSSVHNNATVIGTPTYNAAGLNGLGTINFSGNQGLQTTSNIGISGGADRSVFVVMRRGGDSSSGVMPVQMGDNGGGTGWGITNQYNGIWIPYTINQGGVNPLGMVRAAGTYELYDALHQGTVGNGTHYGYINGTQVGTSTNSPINTPASPFYIGAGPISNNVTGDFGEVLVFNRYLSDAERLSVETYLMNKWFPVTSTATMPEGLVLQLDASTMSLTNGAAVTSMTDLSSAHNNMVAAGTGGTFAIDGNGQKSIHFSGGVNGLQTANNMSITGNASRTVMGVLAFQNGRIALNMGNGQHQSGIWYFNGARFPRVLPVQQRYQSQLLARAYPERPRDLSDDSQQRHECHVRLSERRSAGFGDGCDQHDGRAASGRHQHQRIRRRQYERSVGLQPVAQ